jgi:major intracellular serine protease
MKSHSTTCNLLPYDREDLLTIQNTQQNMGWEITSFDIPKIWESTRGEGVVAAVLDTGADLDHEDLMENLLPGKNFVDPNSPPEDDNGHGCHVAGIICAVDNNLGVVGVAPKTKVIPVKVLDKKGSGSLPNVANGIRWSADQNVDFIVMSLGAPNQMPLIHEAIKYANLKGAIVWCAAGNAGKTNKIFYPAAYSEVIGIGAIDENFNRAHFSCTGKELDFLAPGVKILGTVPDSWYAVLSGTSMANPFAVGIACLLLSYKRKKNLNIPLKNSNDYINLMKSYALPTKNPDFAGKKFFEGFGIIDARKIKDWIKSN